MSFHEDTVELALCRIHVSDHVLDGELFALIGVLTISSDHYDTVYTKIWKESHRDSEAPKIMTSKNQLRADRNQLIQI